MTLPGLWILDLWPLGSVARNFFTPLTRQSSPLPWHRAAQSRGVYNAGILFPRRPRQCARAGCRNRNGV